MKVADLKKTPYNPRKINAARDAMLKASMDHFGDLSGIVFNVRTGHLVGGNHRTAHLGPSWPVVKQAAQDKAGTVALGHIENPETGDRWAYREVDWPISKERRANLAANAQGAEWDMPKLKDMLVELDDGSENLMLTGFSDEDLERMVGFPEPAYNDPPPSDIRCPKCGYKFSA